MRAFEAAWFTHHRERISCWHEDRLDEALEDIATMQQEIQQLQQEIAGQPARVHITATDQEGQPMTSFAPGATITLTAVSDNAENIPVPDTYTWTASAGTLTAGPTGDSTTATLVNAPLGDVTVTATDPAGLVGTLTVTIADQTPVTVTVTAS